MYQPRKIIVVTGHFGSGKTNFSTALALQLAAKGEKVTVVDFDLVNPYFRTADFKDAFAKRGITLRAPDYANTNVDIPSIQFDLGGLAAGDQRIEIDAHPCGDHGVQRAAGDIDRQRDDQKDRQYDDAAFFHVLALSFFD